MSHADYVVEKYRERCPNRNQSGTVCWQRGNVFCDGNELFSYGTHFPLATLIGTETKGGKETHWFVKNGDKFSSSTNGHQASAQSCPGPTVSRTALQAAGIEFNNLVLNPKSKLVVPNKSEDPPRIICWREDSRTYLWRKDGKYTPAHYYGEGEEGVFTVPSQGMFVPTRSETADGKLYGYWHILGIAVIQHDGEYFLCGLDEGSYFVSQLRGRPRNCEHALEMLKPKAVRDAEAKGVRVRRQGEWFFVPSNMNDAALAETLGWTKTKLKSQSSIAALPVRNNRNVSFGSGSNLHVCRQVVLQAGKKVYVTGRVFHRAALFGFQNRKDGVTWGELTGQHQTVNLGTDWYVAYRNTEIQSWSMSGDFD